MKYRFFTLKQAENALRLAEKNVAPRIDEVFRPTRLEREHILSEDTVYFSTAPYNESVDMIIGNHYFCKIF